MTDFCISTSDGLRVFWRCSSMHDSNTQKFVRSKVLSILKPSYRWIIVSGASGSNLGIFGGSEAVIERLTECK